MNDDRFPTLHWSNVTLGGVFFPLPDSWYETVIVARNKHFAVLMGHAAALLYFFCIDIIFHLDVCLSRPQVLFFHRQEFYVRGYSVVLDLHADVKESFQFVGEIVLNK